MGGTGSSRWKDHRRAPLVEDALALDVRGLAPALQEDRIGGSVQWGDGQLRFSLGAVSASGARQLTIEPGGGRPAQTIRLVPVQLGWHQAILFACPSCGRRSRRLYADRKWLRFVCRACGGWTYRSAQTHDKRVDLARRDPVGFIESRARAPSTDRSRMVTAWLAMNAALDLFPPGRGWGRRSMTTGCRIVARMRQEYIDQLEAAERIVDGG